MRGIVYLLIFLPAALAVRAGDDPRVNYLGIEQGLSNNAVTSVYQDSRGFMWFGTYDGLNRYDGYGFTVYRTIIGDPGSIPFNNIATISGDGRGNLWVGGQKGIGIFDPVTARFSVPRFLSYDGSVVVAMRENVHHLKAIGEDLMLAGMHERGLVVFEGGSPMGRQVALEGSGHYDVPCISYDPVHGRIWLFIQKRGLYQYDRRSRRLMLVTDALREALSLQVDVRGRVWLGTDNGLFQLDDDGKGYSTNRMAAKCRVVGIHVNNRNEICIGTDGAGVWKLCPDAGVATPLVSGAGMPLVNSNAVYAIYEDGEGRKWIGTLRGGINVIEPRVSSFKTVVYNGSGGVGGRPGFSGGAGVSGPGNLVDNFILSFCEDANHNVWVGTDGAGLRYWDRKKNRWTEYVNDPKDEGTINNNFITNILRDDKDRVWVATWFGGVNRLDRATGKFEHYSCFNPRTGSEERHVWLLYQDRARRIWASATNDGCLYLYNRVTDRFELFDDAIQSLQSITEDREGGFWGGNYSSLIRIDRERKRHVFFQCGSPIRCLHEDRSGRFWVGTQEGGLLLFDRGTGRYRRYTTADGLPSNTILRILEDGHGNLWLSTYNGLSEFAVADGRFRNFSVSDGLQSTQYSFNAGLLLSSGEMLFGGIKGFNLFFPDSVLRTRQNPPVYLTGIRVLNEAIHADSRFVTGRKMDQVSGLRLPFDQAVLSLDFTALEYKGTDKVNYAYMLVGWDKGWTYSNGGRTANYSSVQEGDYLFRVRVSHADGTWSRDFELLHIVVLPPWYRSWWAYLLYGVCLIMLVAGYVGYVRSRERLRWKLKLARLETEKEKELVARKVAFFTHITHEFRGPLTLIINPLRELLRRDPETGAEVGRGAAGLQYVYRNAQRLLGLVNQLLLFQKSESGGDVVKPAAVDIVELAREVWLCFVEAARMKRMAFSFDAPAGADWSLYVEREKVEIAIYNLVSNALKYTPEGGEVVLGLVESDDSVEIFVRDNGIGIPEEVGGRVFDKFYQICRGGVTSISGFGIGLYLVKQFVEAHGGEVSFTSQKGKGSCFRMRLLKGKEHWDGVEIVEGVGEGVSPLVREIVEPGGGGEKVWVADETVGTAPVAAELVSDKRRVLIVDDDSQMLAYMRHVLEGEYGVVAAASGEDGLEKAKRHRPDLIISDVHMDGISGIELCETIKNDPALGQVPVILLTASASANNKLAGVRHGADDYLSKPFDKDLLVARVGAILRNRERIERSLFEDVTKGGNEPVRINGDEKEFLDRLTAVVEENLETDDFCIKKLSVEMGMSHSNLYQKIKELSGQSLNGFIRWVRLKKAAELLINTPCNVNEAALQVGISDGKYFREQFHKQFGLNPSEYIKKYRRAFSAKYYVNREKL
jgi:signal transduction histidine kinase/ligand-binding sensor domain-containing protein/DNA-binding response OmpR family regulator